MEESSSSSSAFRLLLGAVFAICMVKILAFVYRHFSFWSNLHLPSVNGLPVMGSGWRQFFRTMSVLENEQYLYKAYPDWRYFGIFDVMTPAVFVRDPVLLKEITVQSFDNFTDHRKIVDESVDPLFGKNVFLLRGDRWREMRNTLSPSFTASKMKFMYDLVSKTSKEFVQYLVEHPEYSSVVEGKDLFTRYTTDVIATAAFGISVNSLEDRENEFYARGTDVSKLAEYSGILKFLLFRLSPKTAKLLGVRLMSNNFLHFFRTVVTETIATREKQNIIRPDMIHLLMRTREKPLEHQLTVEDIVAQSLIFFLAGFDTSSTLMCNLVHELAVEQEIQERLRQEIDQHMAEGNGDISYGDLSKMEYMGMVVAEALRKYPAAIFLDRVCVKDFEMPPPKPGAIGLTMKPGMTVMIPTYSIHHDPKYYPNPEKFDPERFNEANKDKLVPYTYMPFGLGPRKCIGNRFALMEIKLLLAHLLYKFIIKRTEKTVHPICFSRKDFTLKSANGYWIGLEKRNDLSHG